MCDPFVRTAVLRHLLLAGLLCGHRRGAWRLASDLNVAAVREPLVPQYRIDFRCQWSFVWLVLVGVYVVVQNRQNSLFTAHPQNKTTNLHK